MVVVGGRAVVVRDSGDFRVGFLSLSPTFSGWWAPGPGFPAASRSRTSIRGYRLKDGGLFRQWLRSTTSYVPGPGV